VEKDLYCSELFLTQSFVVIDFNEVLLVVTEVFWNHGEHRENAHGEHGDGAHTIQ